jgi:hypothetical protein
VVEQPTAPGMSGGPVLDKECNVLGVNHISAASSGFASLDEVDEFPLGGHDDQVDAVSLAAGWLTGRSAGRRVVKRQEGRIPVGSGLPGVSLR